MSQFFIQRAAHLCIRMQSFAREHMQAVQENTAAVEQREQEIKKIAQSITDLNTIFKDLAAMIVDQVIH